LTAGRGPSDAQWFDATSSFNWSDSDQQEQLTVMDELDKLVKELGSFKAPWVPDPPLAFASESCVPCSYIW
jgi:hypothetical protein